MTRNALLEAWERDDLPKMLLGERLVYLEMLYLGNRSGTLRLSQTDLANKLGVTRQAIVKHVDGLMAKKLVRRVGHGRYAVHAEPWSLDRIARAYLRDLKAGEIAWQAELERRAYGDELNGDDPCWDERSSALIDAMIALERQGFLSFNEDDSEYRRTVKPI